MNVHDGLILATEIPNGFTWTLTSRLGDVLTAAEELFGPRDHSWTILGFEFCSEGPQVWYPNPSGKQVVIQLSADVAEDPNRAFFQLCHEVIHCLSPNGTRSANVLEEGLATYFSLWYPLEKGFKPTTVADPSYTKALSLVMQLLAFDRELIKKLRVIQPNISSITAEQLIAINNEFPLDLITAVLAPFLHLK